MDSINVYEVFYGENRSTYIIAKNMTQALTLFEKCTKETQYVFGDPHKIVKKGTAFCEFLDITDVL